MKTIHVYVLIYPEYHLCWNVNTKVSDSCGMSNPNETRKHLNHARGWGFQSDFQTKPFRFTSETNSIFWILSGKKNEPIIFMLERTSLSAIPDFHWFHFLFGLSFVICRKRKTGSKQSSKQITPGCMSDTLMSDTPIKEACSHHMVLVRYSPLYEALTQKCSNQGGKKKSLSRIAVDHNSSLRYETKHGSKCWSRSEE